MTMYKKMTTVCAAVVLAFGLAACGGGDDDTAMMCPEGQVGTYPDCSDPPAPPTPYEMASDAIAAADTAEDAQAAYDAVKDDVTASQGDMLQMKVDARIAEIETADRADAQKMALMTAAGMIDTSDLSTQALVDAARTAIAGLRQAIADAVDVDDTSMYQTTLDNAVMAVDTAQGGIDTATRRTNQMTALSDASDDLQAALAALSGATITQALLDAANNALTALNTAIADGADLTDTEKAPYQHEADNAAAPIQTAQNAFDNDEDEDEKARIAAMAVTASKLYAGIGATPLTGRIATAAETGVISVTRTSGGTAVPLEADEDTMVADNYGWTGERHTETVALADDNSNATEAGMWEAVVYSNVGEATEGAKFSATYTYDATPATDGGTDFTELNITGNTAVAARIASPSFDQSAGVKEFEKDANAVRYMLSGSYHGVSGTYYCTPAASSTCAVEVASDGFNLGGTANADNAFTAGGGTWTFKATDAETRLMNTPDAIYASYGWWIHKAANDGAFTATAFVANRGTVPAASGLDTLNGTATYMGGAAGKYALHSTTGGMNDAGHFTARATLEADFTDNEISGTIDQFMGADGEERDWSVELMKSSIAAAGGIAGDPDDTTDSDPQNTVWTIGGTDGDAAGQWSGTLFDNGDDGVPKVGNGTFSSEFGRDGRMVGAFGVNKQ